MPGAHRKVEGEKCLLSLSSDLMFLPCEHSQEQFLKSLEANKRGTIKEDSDIDVWSLSTYLSVYVLHQVHGESDSVIPLSSSTAPVQTLLPMTSVTRDIHTVHPCSSHTFQGSQDV